MAIAGKNPVVQVSTATGGTYTTIGTINNFTVNIAGENLDVTAFSTSAPAYHSRIQGLKDISWDVSGFYFSTDSNGQTALRTALVNDSNLFARVLLDGTTSNLILQEIKISAYNWSASVDGTVDFSASMEGTGAPTITT